MSESKIQIKLGAAEFQATGEPEWVSKQLDKFLERAKNAKAFSESESANDADSVKADRAGGKSLTTSSIATKLSSKSGPELILAACAHLGLVKLKTQYTRTEIVDEMKTATAFFNKNYVSNLTKYLKTLVVADQLNELSAQTYALSAAEAAKLKNSLGL